VEKAASETFSVAFWLLKSSGKMHAILLAVLTFSPFFLSEPDFAWKMAQGLFRVKRITPWKKRLEKFPSPNFRGNDHTLILTVSYTSTRSSLSGYYAFVMGFVPLRPLSDSRCFNTITSP